MRAARVLAVVFALSAGCQELPPGVLAGGAVEPLDAPEPAGGLDDLRRRVARLESRAAVPAGEESLRRRVEELTAALAESERRLAASERLLANEFGRRAADRVAAVEGPVTR